MISMQAPSYTNSVGLADRGQISFPNPHPPRVDGHAEARVRCPQRSSCSWAGHRLERQAVRGLVSEFTRNISSILADIEAALVPALDGKRVLKGQLADKIERPARLARFQLQNIALFVELNPNNAAASQVIGFPKGSKWRQVTELLWVLGGRGSWPREELAPWLNTGVLPLLAWSVGGGKDVSTDPES